MSIEFSKKDGGFSIFENHHGDLDVYIKNTVLLNALNKINTSYNELGPYLIPQGLSDNITNDDGLYQTYIFLYSNNSNGRQDILYTHNLFDRNFEIPVAIQFTNSPFDDAYPAFKSDYSELYFTSNREGIFNFYKAETDNRLGIIEMFSKDSVFSINKENNLSSDFDDKCPFIFHNFLVFASNREGGYGGFDLYYSNYENGEWTTPRNFGDKINTSFEEYRPIVRPQWEFTNDFMIFSSNRPGGKGGFDLYYVGIDKIK
jgi:hypothetical protein